MGGQLCRKTAMIRQLDASFHALYSQRYFGSGERLRSHGSVFSVDIIDGDREKAFQEMTTIVDRVPGLSCALAGVWGLRALRKVCLTDGDVLSFNLDVACCNVSKTPNCTVRFVGGEAEFVMLRAVAAGEEFVMSPVSRVFRRGMCFLHDSDSDGSSSAVSSSSACAIEDSLMEALQFRRTLIASRRISFRGEYMV